MPCSSYRPIPNSPPVELVCPWCQQSLWVPPHTEPVMMTTCPHPKCQLFTFVCSGRARNNGRLEPRALTPDVFSTGRDDTVSTLEGLFEVISVGLLLLGGASWIWWRALSWTGHHMATGCVVGVSAPALAVGVLWVGGGLLFGVTELVSTYRCRRFRSRALDAATALPASSSDAVEPTSDRVRQP